MSLCCATLQWLLAENATADAVRAQALSSVQGVAPDGTDIHLTVHEASRGLALLSGEIGLHATGSEWGPEPAASLGGSGGHSSGDQDACPARETQLCWGRSLVRTGQPCTAQHARPHPSTAGTQPVPQGSQHCSGWPCLPRNGPYHTSPGHSSLDHQGAPGPCGSCLHGAAWSLKWGRQCPSPSLLHTFLSETLLAAGLGSRPQTLRFQC